MLPVRLNVIWPWLARGAIPVNVNVDGFVGGVRVFICPPPARVSDENTAGSLTAMVIELIVIKMPDVFRTVKLPALTPPSPGL
jgi:hypothetical protein